MTPESKENKKLRTWLKQQRELGNLTFIRLALQPGVERGWPDWVVIFNTGVTCWVEMKAPGRKPSEMQLDRINELVRLRHFAGWFDSADKAIAALASTLGTVTIHAAGIGVPDTAPQRGTTAPAGRSEDKHNP